MTAQHATRAFPATDPLAGLDLLGRIADQQSAAALTAAFPIARTAVMERIPDARDTALPATDGGPRHRRRPRPGLGRGGEAPLAAGQDRPSPVDLSASRSGRGAAAAAAVLLTTCAAWGARHVLEARTVAEGGGSGPALLYAVTFAALAWQVALYAMDRPYRATPAGQLVLDCLNVTIAVPCFNEDPDILRRSLLSMLAQARLPDHVYVVDDGSTTDYADVRAELAERMRATGVRFTWVRTANGGKRHAHAVAVSATPDADVYVTVDSDGILDPAAVAEILAPFADPRVQSVGGLFLAANNRATVLARILDLLYTSAQLTVRGGLSVMGSVMVNSGALAAYRADVIRDALPVYLGETFGGRGVGFSDDSMLTLQAFLKGRTVHQCSAFAFAAMPERWSHHRRQYLRWMRGSFIRTWWRFRYLPLNSYAYWQHLLGWVLSAVTGWAFTDTVILGAVRGQLRWPDLLVPALAGYGLALPYLTVRRSDEPFTSRLFTWLLAPAAAVWALTVLRAFRWWGAATCLQTGWGTRQDGPEITLADS